MNVFRAKVLCEAADSEEIIYANIGELHFWSVFKSCSAEKFTKDPAVLESARAGIPVTTQRRFDVYRDVSEEL